MENTTSTSASKCVVSYYGLNCTKMDFSKSETALIVGIMSFFIATTILSNLLIISAVAFFRQLQTRTNTLALSLAVSDLLVGVVIMPLAMIKSVYKCWFYVQWFCNVQFFCDYWFTTASVLHLSSQRVTRRTLTFMLLFCWIASAIISTPILLSMSPTLAKGRIEMVGCPNDCRFLISVGILFTIGMVPYFTSVLLIMLMYGRIYHVARSQARKIGTQSHGLPGVSSEATSRSIVFTMYEDIFLPYKISFWIGYMNSTINPILYAVFNKQFRHAFKTMLS
uniref:G-protein coupled receptors family 1 profile domain-containing protein n=1 Tax=Petromyzon marinus TaxID=7757 RepID=S4R5H7_PETMA